MKAVIMAGGEGRRLKSITGERPKPMVPLLGRPMMEHILLLLKKHGFDEVCAAVKYRAEDIMRYFGDGRRPRRAARIPRRARGAGHGGRREKLRGTSAAATIFSSSAATPPATSTSRGSCASTASPARA